MAPATRALLPRLAARTWSGDFYLAGSAALALYLAHRPVRDLDLMSNANRLAPQDRRDLLADLLQLDPETRVETARDGYLSVRFPDGISVRFFYYPYPLVEPLAAIDESDESAAGLSVASAIDLGLMKLGAIISRGGRRDFVDLYLLCRELPLPGLLARAADKFGHVGDFPLQAMKGLADTAAADGEPMPRLFQELAWKEVEIWVTNEVVAAGLELLSAP
ncbi:MAG: nucleotidyl transferase AbiEii/AbiGii toxin family protein [Thermoanaerobaculia bacterium]